MKFQNVLYNKHMDINVQILSRTNVRVFVLEARFNYQIKFY